jgi:hypothetical protein
MCALHLSGVIGMRNLLEMDPWAESRAASKYVTTTTRRRAADSMASSSLWMSFVCGE